MAWSTETPQPATVWRQPEPQADTYKAFDTTTETVVTLPRKFDSDVPLPGSAPAAVASSKAQDTRACTCHPDDNPPRPCPRKYAITECRQAAQAAQAQGGWTTGPVVPPSPYSPETALILASYNNDIDAVLMEWKQAQEDVRIVQGRERNLRNAVFEAKFPKANEGTNRIELGNGYSLKAVAKFNYSFDKDNAAVEAALDEIEHTGNEGKFIAERLVSWTPSLSLSEYRQLAESESILHRTIKRIIDRVLTIKPGMPTLEIEEPKQGK